MSIPLLILGDGTYAQETLDIAEAAGGFEPLGFVNSLDRRQCGRRLEGLPVYWVDDLPVAPAACELVAGIVSPQRLVLIDLMDARGFRFARVCHPSAQISRRARVAPGCIVGAGAVVATHAELEPHVIVNRGALVGHHNRIGRGASIGPGAVLSGAVVVGARAFLGAGAVIRHDVDIGPDATVGAGAVVLKPVAAGTTVVGNPARVLPRNA